MVTDIHLHVEEYYDNSWHLVPNNKGPISFYWKEGDKEDTYHNKHDWDPGRNYLLFTILVGVRSYDDTTPIMKEPAGLPKDCSKELMDEYKAWQGDAHTPSFFTLEELLPFKDMTFPKIMIVDMEGFIEYKKGSIPGTWRYYDLYFIEKLISNKEMEERLNLINFADDKEHYTKLNISYPYKEVSKHFWNFIIPAMQKLQDDPKNVRIVFWFNN